MPRKPFRVGTTVKFNSPTGSVGKVTEILKSDVDGYNLYHVKWYYGLDVKDEPMTAVSRYLREHELRRIPRVEFNKIRYRKGWG